MFVLCDTLYGYNFVIYVCLHLNFSFDRRLKVHPNGTLSVQAVTEKDAGDYLCIARNKVADDYRLLRVSVATKPAKIEPRQPLNQMVLFGKPLKVSYEELYIQSTLCLSPNNSWYFHLIYSYVLPFFYLTHAFHLLHLHC